MWLYLGVSREELQEIVERSGLTQAQFAQALGVSQQFVSRMLRGGRPVPARLVGGVEDLDPELNLGPDDPAVERQQQAQKTPAPRGPYRRCQL